MPGPTRRDNLGHPRTTGAGQGRQGVPSPVPARSETGIAPPAQSGGNDPMAWKRELERERLSAVMDIGDIIDFRTVQPLSGGFSGLSPVRMLQSIDDMIEAVETAERRLHEELASKYAHAAADDAGDAADEPVSWARRLEYDRRSLLAYEHGAAFAGPGAAPLGAALMAAGKQFAKKHGENIAKLLMQMKQELLKIQKIVKERISIYESAIQPAFILNVIALHGHKMYRDPALKGAGEKIKSVLKMEDADKIPGISIVRFVAEKVFSLPYYEWLFLLIIDVILAILVCVSLVATVIMLCPPCAIGAGLAAIFS